MFDLVASYRNCYGLIRDFDLVGDELSKMAVGLACLLTVGQFTINLAHWVFAIKFWDLSLKLKASVEKRIKSLKSLHLHLLLVYFGSFGAFSCFPYDIYHGH